MSEFWNHRYQSEIFAYGTDPNVFFKEHIDQLSPGKLLLPAEGEGRNAVYAAGLGWEVAAFDISEEGRRKAMKLAGINQVEIDYHVSDWQNVSYPMEAFDALALIFVHLPSGQRFLFHEKMQKYLKPGGIIIVEAFSKNHLAYNQVNEKAGGPRDVDMLYSVDEIKADFRTYDFLLAEEKIVTLAEGEFHRGPSSVIRFVGRKV